MRVTVASADERRAIEAWLRNNDTSPKTGNMLRHKELTPNHRLWNNAWQLLSPMLPLALWGYIFRSPIFSDLPTWPGFWLSVKRDS